MLIIKQYYYRYLDTERYFQSIDIYLNSPKNHVSNEFTVVVITRKRSICSQNEFHCEPHYLQQTLAALDHESKSRGSMSVAVCSVDPQWENHLDLHAIKNYFPIIFKYNNANEQRPSNKAQETSDYAFCLEETSLRFGNVTKYLIAIEDDAIVFDGFFTTLSSIVKSRIETNILRGELIHNERRWCWMKLYYPEFWCGFGWDANRIWELFWIAIVGGMIGSILSFLAGTVKRKKVSVFWWTFHGAVYTLILALVISRQTLLEMRRIHISMMQVTSDSGCCSTVAVLYPMEEIPKLVNYLRSPLCKRCHSGVDLAIRDYRDKFEMLGFLVQPNLAKHIGMHSTVSSDYKDPIHMMFYDML